MILTVTANPTIDRVYFIDGFETGKVHRADRVTQSAGGKGINVARVAKILGRETSAMGFVGGYTGEYIKSEVEKQGITPLFTDIEGETRTNVNISDKSGKSGEILEPGPEISQEEKSRFIKEYFANVDGCNIICASGSLPRGLTSDFYIELVELAKQKGKQIIVDTSGKALSDVLYAKPYMVKPNKDEISVLMNKQVETDNDIKEALTFLFEKGIELPLVTLGKDGAAAMIDGCFYKFSAPAVKAVNAVGSGDSAVAGIAAGVDSGLSMIDAIKLAMACGVANTQFEKTGFLTRELVDELLPQIRVTAF